jgi:hypothetical protein
MSPLDWARQILPIKNFSFLIQIFFNVNKDNEIILFRLSGRELYFKCENFQTTGSFKVRGALNAIKCHLERGNILYLLSYNRQYLIHNFLIGRVYRKITHIFCAIPLICWNIYIPSIPSSKTVDNRLKLSFYY